MHHCSNYKDDLPTFDHFFTQYFFIYDLTVLIGMPEVYLNMMYHHLLSINMINWNIDLENYARNDENPMVSILNNICKWFQYIDTAQG